MIEIDGSIGEGGGQVLRTSLSLAAILVKPVRVYNIRSNRPNPGLRPQHIYSIKVLADFTEADVTGLTEGSSEIIFKPKRKRIGVTALDIGTAGSISLLIQAITPYCVSMDKPVRIKFIGGTNVRWSPPIDYLQYVTAPILRKMGVAVDIKLIKRGFYPRGGGIVEASFQPCHSIKPLLIDKQQHVLDIKGISYAGKLPSHVIKRQAESALKRIKNTDTHLEKTPIEVFEEPPAASESPGSGILLYAHLDEGGIIGADELGEKGLAAEKVGEHAADNLSAQLKTKAGIDKNMGDMLITYLGLADGRSRIYVSQLTLHTLTNIKVFETMMNVKFKISGNLNKPSYIEVDGVPLH